eukprot:812260-Pleurochrysis_carterae.AAC.3
MKSTQAPCEAQFNEMNARPTQEIAAGKIQSSYGRARIGSSPFSSTAVEHLDSCPEFAVETISAMLAVSAAHFYCYQQVKHRAQAAAMGVSYHDTVNSIRCL